MIILLSNQKNMKIKIKNVKSHISTIDKTNFQHINKNNNTNNNTELY